MGSTFLHLYYEERKWIYVIHFCFFLINVYVQSVILSYNHTHMGIEAGVKTMKAPAMLT